MLKVINLYGGPGTGKSTTAAGLFHLMKTKDISVELVAEYAKEVVWEERDNILEDQLYILAKQNRRLSRLVGKVEFAITDSPLLLSHVYARTWDVPQFHFLVNHIYHLYHNIDIFLTRQKMYHQAGRVHTEEEAKELDAKILEMYKSEVDKKGLVMIPADSNAPADIMHYLNIHYPKHMVPTE